MVPNPFGPTRRIVATALVTLVALTGCSGGGDDVADTSSDAVPTADDAAANDAMYDCLIDQGFPVTRGESGAVNFADPDDDRFAEYQAASAGCTQQLVEQGLVSVASVDELRDEFRLASALHGCLVAADFPLTPLPSEQVYVEQHDSINVLAATAPVDIDAARTACPDEFRALDDR